MGTLQRVVPDGEAWFFHGICVHPGHAEPAWHLHKVTMQADHLWEQCEHVEGKMNPDAVLLHAGDAVRVSFGPFGVFSVDVVRHPGVAPIQGVGTIQGSFTCKGCSLKVGRVCLQGYCVQCCSGPKDSHRNVEGGADRAA